MCTKQEWLVHAHLWWLFASVGMIIFTWLCLAPGGTRQFASRGVGKSGPVSYAGQAPGGREILRAATQAFRPSLEMKENVEFLLTPALLVQEAMAQDVVPTYPWE